MKIGIIGAAEVGQTLASAFLLAGHEVILSNRRGHQTLDAVVTRLGSKCVASSVEEAAAQQAVVLAIPWTNIEEVLRPLPDWEGRVLIDATNIFLNYAPSFEVAELGDQTGSEIVAQLARGAKVVKAFNTLPISKFFSAAEHGYRRIMCVAGDHSDANELVVELGHQIGLAPFILGDLHTGGKLMQLKGQFSGVELFRRA